MTARVGIVDYGMGNLLSVRNAFASLGADVHVADRGDALTDVSAVVVPGVGAFSAGMHGLHERGFVQPLAEHRAAGTPILGICLGMQLLMSSGSEGGHTTGLGWINGTCERMTAGEGLRIPHIGWNEVAGTGPLFTGLAPNTSFYFVHSFQVVPVEQAVVAGTTQHGPTFVSAMQHDRTFGVQFHPEKSHKSGLALLRNFLAFVENG